MVAYNINSRFAPMIKAGLKEQFICENRRRHAYRGEWIQLYQLPRIKGAEKIISDPVCTAVLPFHIAFVGEKIWEIRVGDVPVLNIGSFAQAEGFRDPDEMAKFWVKTRRFDVNRCFFSGSIIEWIRPCGSHLHQVAA